ncbi:MAG: winged helix-turn-helix domain-containing protein [Nanoarchaeota archaeon]|nr:winged helix-turn-helix domain-containing protein [Nanoarchaeota archaeon]
MRQLWHSNRLFLSNLKTHIEQADEFAPAREEGSEAGSNVWDALTQVTKQISELQAAVAVLMSRPEDGVRKRKVRVREDVVATLAENPGIDAASLGELVGLSRARASEYLSELVREGNAVSVLHGKKRLFSAVPERNRQSEDMTLHFEGEPA